MRNTSAPFQPPAPGPPSARRAAIRVLSALDRGSPMQPLPPDGERLAALGMITASVGHELASPLSALIANVGFATARLSEATVQCRPVEPQAAASVLGALRDALDAAERIRAIAGELRALSQAETGPAETLVVARAVERAIALTRGEIGPRARIEMRLGPVPPIRGREGHLVQVLINLLVNAAHAIPPGAPSRHRVTVVTALRAPGSVMVEVHDTGCGIPPEVLPRIFEPFFTTKPAGCGTGLGLSVCRRLLGAMGGDVEVESEVGRGTTVRVSLPGAGPSEA